MSVEYKYFRVPSQITNDFDAAGLSEIFESDCFDLGTSWDAVHFALTGSREETDEILSKAIFGDELVLIGGARFSLIDRDATAEVLNALSQLDMETVRNRFDAEHGEELYSFDYDNLDSAIEETLSLIQLLTNFYNCANKHGEVVLVMTV